MTKTKTIMAAVFIGLFVAAFVSQGWATTMAVVPSEYEFTDGQSEIGEPINGYGSSTGQLVQYVIEAKYLTGLQNQELTGLTFRLDKSYDPDLPEISYTDYTVILSSWAGGGLASTPNSNITDGHTAVSGAFSFVDGAFSTGGDPNGFGNFITFDNPYFYASGDLLVTLSHTQPTGGEQSSYWSTDAFAGAYSALIVHDANGYDSTGSLWSYSPVTQFTTSALTAEGTILEESPIPDPATPVPEPATLLLFGSGMAGLAGLARIKRKKTV